MTLLNIQRSISAILIILGCVLLQLRSVVASNVGDDPLLQRVMRVPVDGGYDRLVVAIEALRYIKLNDANGSRVLKDDLYYAERFLERLWLGDLIGAPRPKVASVFAAIALERSLESSAPLSLFELRAKVYAAALLLRQPQFSDPPPESILQAPDNYVAVGEHRWKYASQPQSDDALVEIALKNELDHAIPLPPVIQLYYSNEEDTDPNTDPLVGLACVERDYHFGNDPADVRLELPKLRMLGAGQRVIVLCSSFIYIFPSNKQLLLERALQDLGNRKAWVIHPSPNQSGENKAEDLLWLSRALRTDETRQQALELLGKRDSFAITPEIRHARFVEAVMGAAVFLIVCWLVYAIYSIVREKRWRAWGPVNWPLVLAQGASGVAIVAYLVFVYTLDPKWGWFGDVMIEIFGLAVAVALAVLWFAYLTYWAYRQSKRHEDADRKDPQ